MIGFIASVPGWVIAFCVAFPFLAIALGLIAFATGYVLTLKLHAALEDARDIRNRKP